MYFLDNADPSLSYALIGLAAGVIIETVSIIVAVYILNHLKPVPRPVAGAVKPVAQPAKVDTKPVVATPKPVPTTAPVSTVSSVVISRIPPVVPSANVVAPKPVQSPVRTLPEPKYGQKFWYYVAGRDEPFSSLVGVLGALGIEPKGNIWWNRLNKETQGRIRREPIEK